MSQRPDFSADNSGPYLKPRLIPKRHDPPMGTGGAALDDDHQPPAFEPPRASAARAQLWFEETVVVPESFRELLVNYSHVAPAEVDEHVIRVRDRAWEVHPYPCLGQFRFVELNLSSRPGDIYPRLLSVLSASAASDGPVFLDIGACLGQDVRKLIYDGAQPSSVAGAELSGTFIELGYELFRDRPETVKMVQADVLKPIDEGSSLVQFRGKLKVVQLGMILHLFTWDEQIVAFVNAIKLLRDEKGVLVIGQATGNLDGAERKLAPDAAEKASWKHNVQSFHRLISDVETQTGTRWNVKAELDEGLSVNDGKRTWDDPRTRRLLFEIERVE